MFFGKPEIHRRPKVKQIIKQKKTTYFRKMQLTKRGESFCQNTRKKHMQNSYWSVIIQKRYC